MRASWSSANPLSRKCCSVTVIGSCPRRQCQAFSYTTEAEGGAGTAQGVLAILPDNEDALGARAVLLRLSAAAGIAERLDPAL
jgi:hypothetical protein